jgi:hypothetical protein
MLFLQFLGISLGVGRALQFSASILSRVPLSNLELLDHVHK